jgi:hypothetical protein
VLAEAPGRIRPGQGRPFYFTAAFPDDERQLRLSIVGIDRDLVQPEPDSTSPGVGRSRAPRPSQPAAEEFTDRATDNFFMLRWKTVTKDAAYTEISGVVENRDGPALQSVTLLVRAYTAGGGVLETKELVLRGPFGKKEMRRFTATFRGAAKPERVTVRVASYDFFQPGGGR